MSDVFANQGPTLSAQCTRILYSNSKIALVSAWGGIVNAAVVANSQLHTTYTNVQNYLHGSCCTYIIGKLTRLTPIAAHPIRVSLVVGGVTGIGTGLAVNEINSAMSGQAKSCTGSVTTTVTETITYTVGQTANVGESRTSYDSTGTTLVTVAGKFSPKSNLDKTGYCGAKKTGSKTKRGLVSYFQAMRL